MIAFYSHIKVAMCYTIFLTKVGFIFLILSSFFRCLAVVNFNLGGTPLRDDNTVYHRWTFG